MKTLLAALAGAVLGSAVTASVLWPGHHLDAQSTQAGAAPDDDAGRTAAGPARERDAARGELGPAGRAGGTSSGTQGSASPAERAWSAERERITQHNTALQAEIAELRETLRQSHEGGRASKVLDLDATELAELATRCELRWDMPSISTERAESVSDDDREALGWSEAQARAANAAFEAHNARILAKLRALYGAATGEQNVSTVSAQAMISEIDDKAGPGEIARAFQRLSAERAGLASAPPPGEERPLVEQLHRLMVEAGDDVERSLAQRVGPAEARALRALHGGFGSKSIGSHGCP